MKRSANWVAASVFFLAGSFLYAVPAMARSVLYAGRMSAAAWQYPDKTVEQLVPDWLGNLGFLAYLLCVFALGWPQIAQWLNAYFCVPPPQQAPQQEPDQPTT